ncbi:hypothetical protein L227DRAFT_656467 [Lentinus tigrinus ALCF2SS1-6]|uniref:HNH nuclease domain-containing protein n=1 Tax=Lentinus tigrinus ALCF2SS1-6 TaxID=1328759 RepID=A0A5C2RYW6_9APHY|nr:hypothetical protein L227DRAFT_656467 [Lentinus tigrinus ALCF2SS1-6]
MSEAVGNFDDPCCIVTGFKSRKSCDTAHICPKDHVDWFEANDLSFYTYNSLAGVDDIGNVICLRSDVHRFLDGHGFLIYPTDTTGNSFMAYVIDDTEADYVDLLHRRLLEVPDRVFAQLLYARFAYTIINLPRSQSFELYPPNEGVAKARAKRAQKLSSQSRRLRESVDRQGSASRLSVVDDTLDHSEEEYPFDEENLEERFFRRFPQLRMSVRYFRYLTLACSTGIGEEREYSTDPYYNMLMIHPESPRMRKLMEEYKRKNPQVSQRSQDTADGDDADAEAAWGDIVGEDDTAERDTKHEGRTEYA